MNILITGGAGFAGSYITNFFVKRGDNVTATYRKNQPQERVEGVRMVQQDLSEKITISGEFDAIIHTACSKSGAELSAEEYTRDNIESARQLVDYARRKNIKTIVYFSTRSVYGEIRQSEVKEENDIINSDKYGLTKYIAEKIFQEAKDINTIGLRTPGIIGPKAHDIWLVSIVNKIRNGESVTISDFNTKNLVWINDIAEFICKLVIMSQEGKKYKYPVVNLSCRESVNNIEIVKMIKERFASDSNIVVKEPASDLFVLNSDKAQEMGFAPLSPLEIVNSYLDCIL